MAFTWLIKWEVTITTYWLGWSSKISPYTRKFGKWSNVTNIFFNGAETTASRMIESLGPRWWFQRFFWECFSQEPLGNDDSDFQFDDCAMLQGMFLNFWFAQKLDDPNVDDTTWEIGSLLRDEKSGNWKGYVLSKTKNVCINYVTFSGIFMILSQRPWKHDLEIGQPVYWKVTFCFCCWVLPGGSSQNLTNMSFQTAEGKTHRT